MFSSPSLDGLRRQLVSRNEPILNENVGVVHVVIVGAAARRSPLVAWCGGLDRMGRWVG